MVTYNFVLYLKKILIGVGTKILKKCSNYTDKVNKNCEILTKIKVGLSNGCGSHPHQIYNEILSEQSFYH